MKALERYVKKNKTQPYGSTASKGSWKGPEGPKMDDQYASDAEKPDVVDDAKDMDETTDDGKEEAYTSIKKKGKIRSYLSGD